MVIYISMIIILYKAHVRCDDDDDDDDDDEEDMEECLPSLLKTFSWEHIKQTNKQTNKQTTPVALSR
jgi:hypothetical protein